MNREQEDALARIIWNYHRLNHPLVKSDVMLVMGSDDMREADYAAQLYHEGWAPVLIFAGGLGNLTRGKWPRPEADLFAERAIELGVPEDSTFVENQSENTGDNILFSRKILSGHGIYPESVLLVHTPYSERRDYATFKKVWPEPKLAVTSPPFSFDEYITDTLPRDWVISLMVGDLQRIREYPARGFQIPQNIPDEVWEAGQALIKAGYTRYLIGG